MLSIKNGIGLEGEFILKDKQGKLVYPEDVGLGYDEYIILGEFRSLPGYTREETIGNFFKALSNVLLTTKTLKLELLFGFEEISSKLRSEILKRMGTKVIQDTKNLYKTDLVGCSDDVVVDGKVVSSKISTGLHIHFSREVISTYEIDHKIQTEKRFIITPRQRSSIVRTLDKKIFPLYQTETPLKYRQAGFYEDKPWGFEYRSLPMNNSFVKVEEITTLVDFCFSLLERLDK